MKAQSVQTFKVNIFTNKQITIIILSLQYMFGASAAFLLLMIMYAIDRDQKGYGGFI